MNSTSILLVLLVLRLVDTAQCFLMQWQQIVLEKI
jgi:hypothetical protein